jgi:hypothetical protein
MSKKKGKAVPGKIGSEQHARTAQVGFYKQVGLLRRLVIETKAYEDACAGPRLGPIQFVVWSVGMSTQCVACMDFMYLHEGFMLCRSVIERVITCLYLLFCDDKEFQRYLTYTKQKAYRVSERVLYAGDLVVSLKRTPPLSLEDDAELRRAVEEFTSKKGKTISRWRSVSLQDMLDYLGKNTSIKLGALCLAYMYVYDDASEALHGTLYGSLFHYDAFQGQVPETPEGMKESWFTQWSTLYICMSACVSVLIEGIGEVAEVAELVSESKATLKSMGQTASSEKRPEGSPVAHYHLLIETPKATGHLTNTSASFHLSPSTICDSPDSWMLRLFGRPVWTIAPSTGWPMPVAR